MDKTDLMLSGLVGLAMVAFFLPNVLAFNRGKILRNIALWLAVFTGLALIYKNFGPNSEHPLFSLPAAMVRHEPGEPQKDDGKAGDDSKSDGSQGYTPPAE